MSDEPNHPSNSLFEETNCQTTLAAQPMIVSSDHLASTAAWRLSEYEYGLIVAFNAFSRWMTRCMAAAGFTDFSPLDILVLHNCNHRKRAKRLSDICFVLNIEDQHTVNYSLKKLMKAELVESKRRGKEKFYLSTEKGAQTCQEYRDLRERCLVDTIRSMDADGKDLSRMATLLRGLSGIYDQAARAVSST
ncbi:winged helix DNA-binding protein [Rhodospirillum sp. A1_3_36]|uniref:winged helix DNA-binding protein n=1 Tax=Rhodospirillum sp. A1_3_36 TaxID=3391666 RepID=UPI0039A74EAC